MKKRVLVIQNARCEHLGTLQSMFENDGFEINRLVAVDAHELPDTINGNDALVILGGPASAYDEHQYLKDQEGLIRDAIAKNIPTLGICLGSQLLAKASGARVYRGPRKEIGWYNVELTDTGLNLFNGLKKSMTVFQWHDDTYDLPKNAVTLAKSELYPVQAFRVGSVVGIQFHLEVSREMVMDWMREYRAELDSAHNYINANNIIAGLDTNLPMMNQYTQVLYQNFRRLVMQSEASRKCS